MEKLTLDELKVLESIKNTLKAKDKLKVKPWKESEAYDKKNCVECL